MKAYEYLEDHGILFAGIVLLFLLQSTLLVFLGLSAGLSILVCSIWLLFFTVYFLQAISHDFRTPLSLILAALDKLRREGLKEYYLLISNFVYEKQGATRKKIMQYRKCLPQDRIFGWEEVKQGKEMSLLQAILFSRYF